MARKTMLRTLLFLPAAVGTLAVIAYLSQSLGIGSFSARADLLLALMIGPLAAFGVIRFTDELDAPQRTLIRSARALLVLSFAMLTLMVSVQQMGLLRYRSIVRPDSVDEVAARYFFQLLSSVQLGIDVSFDVLYCLGVICLSVVLGRAQGYGKMLAWTGASAAFLLLAANLVAFPHTPASIGLVDFGPLTGLWWLWVIAARLRIQRRNVTGLPAV